MPRLNGSLTTWAPCASATAAVRSREPSSTTTISSSRSKARISSITRAMHSSSLYAGTIAIRRTPVRRGSPAAARSSWWTPSTTDRLRDADAEQVEQPPGAMQEGVLVERPLAGGGAQLLGARRILEQLPVRGDRLVGVLDDEQLPARLEPALDPLVRVGDDRRAGHRQLERTRRGRSVDRGVRPPGHVQVDPRGRDRTREDVERHVAGQARATDVAADVRLLLDRVRPEELRVGAPEDRLGTPGAELSQPLEPALRVRDEQVVLGRVGAEVVVEAGVVAAELRQAHRDVAVVVDDRDVEPLAEQRRDPAQVAHRDGEDDDRVDVPLALEQVDEVASPARRHPAPDRLPHPAVGVARVALRPADVPVAL